MKTKRNIRTFRTSVGIRLPGGKCEDIFTVHHHPLEVGNGIEVTIKVGMEVHIVKIPMERVESIVYESPIDGDS